MSIEVLGIALNFLSGYAAEKGLDKLLGAKSDRDKEMSLEEHVYILLSDSLEEFCKRCNIEFDENAIYDTYNASRSGLIGLSCREQLRLILERATELEVSEDELAIWIEIVENNLVSAKHEKLFRAIQLRNINRESESVAEPAWMRKYMADNYLEVTFEQVGIDDLLADVRTELSHDCWRQTRELILELSLNAFSHGNATEIMLHIDQSGIVVQDDGAAFDTRNLAQPGDTLSGGRWTFSRYIRNYPEVNISYSRSEGKNKTAIQFVDRVFSVNGLCEITLPKSLLSSKENIIVKHPNSRARYYYADFSEFASGSSLFCMSGVVFLMSKLVDFCTSRGSEIFLYVPRAEAEYDDIDGKLKAFIECYGYSDKLHIVCE